MCPQCGASNEPGRTSAANARLRLAISDCVSKEIERCADSSSRDAAPENLEGERKTVTALFADIKGSMDLIEDLDPEEARAIVDPALKLMIDAAHRYGGYIVQSTGDGIFALFGAPIAHEDHPQRALFAALRMQEDVKRYAEKLRAEKGVQSASPGRGEHRRSRGPFDQDRRGAHRVHADRTFDQPRVAIAGARGSGLDCDQRERCANWSKATSRSSRSGRHGSKASASRSMFTR